MVEVLEVSIEQDSPAVVRLRQWVEETHGVTDPKLQTEIIAGVAAAYLAGNPSPVSENSTAPIELEGLILQ